VTSASQRVDGLRIAFRAASDPERAVAMARYMRDQFAFFGVPTPERRATQRRELAAWKPTEQEVVDFARECWAGDQRELQYAACDVIQRFAKHASPEFLDLLETLVTTKSWWDSVDALAHAVGSLVFAHPGLVDAMDDWIDAGDFWLARVAIIHQLRFKSATDSERLFRYCERRAADPEFFVRKAIGWALREYAKTDPAAVRSFVAAHAEVLSSLSRREALKNLAIHG
jgi:3-methyladenine DNA glycosylase AlkD